MIITIFVSYSTRKYSLYKYRIGNSYWLVTLLALRHQKKKKKNKWQNFFVRLIFIASAKCHVRNGFDPEGRLWIRETRRKRVTLTEGARKARAWSLGRTRVRACSLLARRSGRLRFRRARLSREGRVRVVASLFRERRKRVRWCRWRLSGGLRRPPPVPESCDPDRRSRRCIQLE